MDYPGHVIMPVKLASAIDLTKVIWQAAFKSDISKLRCFPGACIVYRRFVLSYEKISRPLTEMIRKDMYQDWDNQTEEQVAALEKLKDCLVKPPFLSLPMGYRPFMIDKEVSGYALGAVLLQ